MSALPIEFSVTSGDDLLARFALGPGQYVLGRSEACEIVIDLDGISEKHARISINEEGATVEDLGSEHGTWVGGQQIDEQAPVYSGEHVEFGRVVTLRVESPLDAPKRMASRAAASRTKLKDPLRKTARRKPASKREKALPRAPEPVAKPADIPDPMAARLESLEREMDALRRQHESEVEALKRAKAAVEGDLRIVRDALIIKQAAAAKHLKDVEEAHAAKVRSLEQELRTQPPVAPAPIVQVQVAQPVVTSRALAIPTQTPAVELIPPPTRVHRREDELAHVVGLLHSRESQVIELRGHLRRTEDRCAELSDSIARLEKDRARVDRWRKLSSITALCTLGAVVGIIALSGAIRTERERAERAETIVSRIKTSAPRFAHDAVELAEQGELESALVKATAAIALDPQSAQLRLVEGNILQSLLRLDAAAAAYREALALDPKLSLAASNLVLCQRILASRRGIQAPENLYALHRIMMEQKRLPEALQMAERLPEDRQLLHQTWRAILDQAGVHARLDLNDDGTFDLDLSGPGRRDLSVLRGMPLRSLSLANTTVSDLSELRGLPLRRLDLSGTRVRDLSPLEGMGLEHLSIANTDVGTLFPLRGMPLRELSLDHTSISSISELQGMPLETVRLAGTKVWSIQPLANLPIRILDLARTRVADISALEHLPIEWLDLEGTSVSDIRSLAGSSLRFLNLAGTLVQDLAPLANLPLRELNLGGCRELRSVSALTACGDLERLIIPRHSADIASLQTLQRLRFLSFERDPGSAMPDQTAREFWITFAKGQR